MLSTLFYYQLHSLSTGQLNMAGTNSCDSGRPDRPASSIYAALPSLNTELLGELCCIFKSFSIADAATDATADVTADATNKIAIFK